MRMLTTAKANRKVLSQFITIYQSIIEFSIDKLGMDVIIKFNKQDPDAILDDVNAHLIDVCEEYLKENKIGLDKFQLSTIILDLFTKTVSELDEPYKVIIKESKALIGDYLEKNKQKKETLERIKKENEELDKAYEKAKKENKIKTNIKAEIKHEDIEPTTHVSEKKQIKKAVRGTDSLAIDDFYFPIG